jgi:RTX calcium-binding nonapeptide repeat (4 copies)
MKSRWILFFLIPSLVVLAPISAHAATPNCFGATATIVGTPGDDHLVGTGKDDVIVGLGGNDTILGGAGYDLTCAGRGDDIVKAGGGHDDSAGGPGDDEIFANGSGGPGEVDAMIGNGGNDVFHGGPGTAAVDFDFALGAVSADLAAGTATGEGNDTLRHIDFLVGSRFDDILGGTNGFNIIAGGGGSDRISGRRGPDFLSGEGFGFFHGFNDTQPYRAPAGNDVIKGGRSRDALIGNRGHDTLRGGPGNEQLLLGGRGATRSWVAQGQTGSLGGAGTMCSRGVQASTTRWGGRVLMYAGPSTESTASTYRLKVLHRGHLAEPLCDGLRLEVWCHTRGRIWPYQDFARHNESSSARLKA